MTETVVHLKPRAEWRPGMTLERLRAEMDAAVRLPGVSNIWTMPIVNRIDMLTTGIRSEVGVKIYGGDLGTLETLGRQVAAAVGRVPGAANVYPEQVTSGQYLNITIEREAAARHGIGVGEIQDVIETAIGETVLTTTIEGRRRFPVRVRYGPQHRSSPQALGSALVTSASGAQIPLAELTRMEAVRGPAMISSENGLLFATVLLNVQNRDIGGFVSEAQQAVASSVALPPGYYIGWSGRYENQERARRRLQIVLPIVLLVIFVLLYFTYRSALEAAHVLLAVPFALTGGVYLVWLLGYNFSVAVWVGFIALFGTAVQTAVVMVIYLEEALERHRAARGGALTHGELRQAVMEGALLRLRPKVMTVSTVVAGLLPIMWSTRVGAEVMKPLAAPVLGGMVSSLLHVLLVTPVVFFWLRERQLGLSPEPAASSREVAADRFVTSRRRRVAVMTAVVVTLGAALWLWPSSAPGPGESPGAGPPAATAASGDLRIAVLAPGGGLRQGRNAFAIEFRSAATGELVDAGVVRMSATMAMPGMAMSAGVQVTRSGTAGRYTAVGQFGMAGSWPMTIEWDGASGGGRVSLEGTVR